MKQLQMAEQSLMPICCVCLLVFLVVSEVKGQSFSGNVRCVPAYMCACPTFENGCFVCNCLGNTLQRTDSPPNIGNHVVTVEEKIPSKKNSTNNSPIENSTAAPKDDNKHAQCRPLNIFCLPWCLASDDEGCPMCRCSINIGGFESVIGNGGNNCPQVDVYRCPRGCLYSDPMSGCVRCYCNVQPSPTTQPTSTIPAKPAENKTDASVTRSPTLSPKPENNTGENTTKTSSEIITSSPTITSSSYSSLLPADSAKTESTLLGLSTASSTGVLSLTEPPGNPSSSPPNDTDAQLTLTSRRPSASSDLEFSSSISPFSWLSSYPFSSSSTSSSAATHSPFKWLSLLPSSLSTSAPSSSLSSSLMLSASSAQTGSSTPSSSTKSTHKHLTDVSSSQSLTPIPSSTSSSSHAALLTSLMPPSTSLSQSTSTQVSSSPFLSSSLSSKSYVQDLITDTSHPASRPMTSFMKSTSAVSSPTAASSSDGSRHSLTLITSPGPSSPTLSHLSSATSSVTTESTSSSQPAALSTSPTAARFLSSDRPTSFMSTPSPPMSFFTSPLLSSATLSSHSPSSTLLTSSLPSALATTTATTIQPPQAITSSAPLSRTSGLNLAASSISSLPQATTTTTTSSPRHQTTPSVPQPLFSTSSSTISPSPSTASLSSSKLLSSLSSSSLSSSFSLPTLSLLSLSSSSSLSVSPTSTSSVPSTSPSSSSSSYFSSLLASSSPSKDKLLSSTRTSVASYSPMLTSPSPHPGKTMLTENHKYFQRSTAPSLLTNKPWRKPFKETTTTTPEQRTTVKFHPKFVYLRNSLQRSTVQPTDTTVLSRVAEKLNKLQRD